VTTGLRQGSLSTPGGDPTWRERASCQFIRPDLFFPAGTTGLEVEEIEAAKAVCRSCPVQDSCLQFALETNQEAGIWGGTTEVERRRVRRARLADQRRRAG
jgi:WhiB family redox-sensing transcriptional regulator